MKTPRKRKPGTNHSISLTDEQTSSIDKWAAEAGMSRSRFIAHCALTVDLSPKSATAHPLVLTPDQQHEIARSITELADVANSEMSPRIAELARVMMQERLETMAREGRRAEAYELLCTVFGEQRAEIVAAVMMPPEQASEPAPPWPRAILTRIHRMLVHRSVRRPRSSPAITENRHDQLQ